MHNVHPFKKMNKDALSFFEYFRASIPLVLSNLVGSTQGLFHTILAGMISASALSVTGYVTRSYFVYGSLVIAINAAGSIRLNRLGGRPENQEQYLSSFKTLLMFSAIAAFLCFVIFVIFAPFLVAPVSDGNTYEKNIFYCRCMGVSYALITIANPFYLGLVASKKGKEVFYSSFIAVCIGFVAAASSYYIFKDLIFLGLSAALTEIFFFALTVYFFNTHTTSIKNILPRFKKTLFFFKDAKNFLQDAGNLLIANLSVNIADYLLFAIFSKDLLFLATMALYYSSSSCIQGASLGFASAAAVEVARAMQEKKDTLKKIINTTVLYALMVAFFSSVTVMGIFLFSASNNQEITIPFSVTLLCSVMVFSGATTAFLSRAVLRSGGDTAYIKKFAIFTSIGLRVPWTFSIAHLLLESSTRTTTLFIGYLVISGLSLILVLRRTYTISREPPFSIGGTH